MTDKTRDAFEAWWKSSHVTQCNYKYGAVRDGWDAWQAATLAEREGCVKVCIKRDMGDCSREDQEAVNCAAAIQRRGDA